MSLSRLLQAEETQICPVSILEDPVLTRCKEWQTTEQTKYSCDHDEYLQTFTPGQYKGVVANYLSFNTAQSTGHFLDRAKLFEECTGGVINFAEATDIAEGPIKDIGSASSNGAELYDAYLMIYSFTSEASSLGLLETLNDRIRASNKLLQYEDIFPKVRSMGEYRKDGKTNIDLLMADGDFFVPIIRIDLLERDNKPLPHTWEDVVELAKFYNGTDLNDDGVADDFGFCIYPRTGSGFNDAWIPELMYSTWATTDQTTGIQQGFLFDEETLEPRIGNGFEHAMNIWKELWENSADGCITSNFVEGRCAIGFAPPGCWKGTFVNGEEGGVAWRNKTDGSVLRDENGEALWRPRMKDGSYAEPYRFKPFGSLKVIDRDTDQFKECGPGTCPKGERIPSTSRLAGDDRAKVLAESPHVGKLINRAPFYWSGGYGTGIRKSADPAAKDLMWDFFVYVNTPITSIDDVVIPSWLDAWRYSQLSDYKHNFQKGGWSFDSWNEHQKVMLWALGNDVNSALTLRLPGVLAYTRDVMLDKFSEYMDGLIAMEDMKASVTQGWKDATTTHGKLSQVQIYRASLGLDPLSELDLCRLHRVEMDNQDNTVCADPQLNQIGSIRIAGLTLMSIAAMTSIGFGLWTYAHREKKIVKAAQPMFLEFICAGTLVVSAAIIPLSIDDEIASDRGCDIACMATPWLVSTGFTITFSALFSKIWRINKLMKSAREFSKVTVKERDVLAPFGVVFSLNFAFLLAWTLVDPLQWVRAPVNVGDPSGDWNTYGTCKSEGKSSTAFVVLILVINLVALILACVQAYHARNISDEYCESKYVGVAVVSLLELSAVGLPLVLLVQENPTAGYFLKVAIIFVVCISVLLLMFLPKYIYLRKYRNQGHSRNQLSGWLRNTQKQTQRQSVETQTSQEAGRVPPGLSLP